MTHLNQHGTTIQHWMECYNVTGEPDDDDPLNVKIGDFEVTCTVEGFYISSD